MEPINVSLHLYVYIRKLEDEELKRSFSMGKQDLEGIFPLHSTKAFFQIEEKGKVI